MESSTGRWVRGADFFDRDHELRILVSRVWGGSLGIVVDTRKLPWHTNEYGRCGFMKTTIDIQDELLARAKRRARDTGRTLRAVVEDGLRGILAAPTGTSPYRLPDMSVGQAEAEDPLEVYSWQDLRGLIYGESEIR